MITVHILSFHHHTKFQHPTFNDSMVLVLFPHQKFIKLPSWQLLKTES